MVPIPLDRELSAKKARAFRSKSKFRASDYEALLVPFLGGRFTIAPLKDIFCGSALYGKHVIGLRHDVDHDFETALRIADWEARNGVRATYCVLHTAWYYGARECDRYVHYGEFVDFCLRLQDMGHEINFHNNLVALSLREGVDAEAMLAHELAALRSYGIEILGTSGHGDALCDQLQFFNLELFKDRCWASKGGPRKIVGPNGTATLGSVDMADHGLIYEAYDFPRTTYITDSGGRPRLRLNTRGQRGLRLAERDNPMPFASLSGVLTHPIWWDFEAPAADGRDSPFRQIVLDARAALANDRAMVIDDTNVREEDKTCPGCGAPLVNVAGSDLYYQCGYAVDTGFGADIAPCEIAEGRLCK